MFGNIWIFIFRLSAILLSFGKFAQSGVLFENQLVAKLLDGYRPSVRPVVALNDTIVVSVRVLPYQLIDVDIIDQTIRCLFWYEARWFDHILRWQPEEHGGIKQITLNKEFVWKPDITVYQRLNWKDTADLRNTLSDPRVNYNGLVEIVEPKLLETSCQVDVYFFPFDRHQCEVSFGSWGSTVDTVDTALGWNPVDTKNFQANIIWELRNYTGRRSVDFYEGEGNYSSVTFIMSISRRPMFIVATIIFPTGLISALSIMNFFVPCETGEKMGFGITLFLALCVNMLVISDMMPQTGVSLPVISVYCLVSVSVLALSLLSTMIVLRVHYKQIGAMTKAPHWVQSIFIKRLGPLLLVRSARDWIKAEHREKLREQMDLIKLKASQRENGLNSTFPLREEPAENCDLYSNNILTINQPTHLVAEDAGDNMSREIGCESPILFANTHNCAGNSRTESNYPATETRSSARKWGGVDAVPPHTKNEAYYPIPSATTMMPEENESSCYIKSLPNNLPGKTVNLNFFNRRRNILKTKDGVKDQRWNSSCNTKGGKKGKSPVGLGGLAAIGSLIDATISMTGETIMQDSTLASKIAIQRPGDWIVVAEVLDRIFAFIFILNMIITSGLFAAVFSQK